jgi:hypothetical protein
MERSLRMHKTVVIELIGDLIDPLKRDIRTLGEKLEAVEARLEALEKPDRLFDCLMEVMEEGDNGCIGEEHAGGLDPSRQCDEESPGPDDSRPEGVRKL